MREILRKLGDIFDRRTKQKLFLATLGSLGIALLDTAAITMVYPLVNLATGASSHVGVLGWISEALGDPDAEQLTLLLTVGVVSVFIVKDLASMAFSWWMTGFIFGERVRTSARILQHFVTAPYTQISLRSTSELLRAMDYAVVQVFGSSVYGVMYAVTNSIAIIAIVLALAVVSPFATLAAVAYFGVAALLYLRLVKPRAASAGTVMVDASLKGWRTAFAALGGLKELNLRGTQEHFVRNYRDAQLRGAYAGRTASFLGALPRYMLEILFILAIGLMLLIGTTTSASSSPGGIVSLLALFVAAGFRLLPSVTGLLGNLSSIKVAAQALDIVHAEVLEARRAAERGSETVTATRLPFREILRIENLTFSYPRSEAPVLKSVELDIAKGSSVALIGGSGAGKTTLVDLLLGLHEPDSGRISVDGVDIASQKRAWQRIVGYVPQDVYILDATLAENIAFDQDWEDIDRTLLAHVIEQAQLVDLVAELPEGTETQVGEKGTRLSGGQRQRIGIARALYRQPDLLVFDEATAALDNETEHRINETVAALHGRVTVVVVAHRLSTVRRADKIAFLKNGRVETTGTFEEVCASNRDFAHLVELGSLDPASESQ